MLVRPEDHSLPTHQFALVVPMITQPWARFTSLICTCNTQYRQHYLVSVSLSVELAYAFMVLSLFFFGAIQSGLSCAYLEVAPAHSGIMNTIGVHRPTPLHTSNPDLHSFIYFSFTHLFTVIPSFASGNMFAALAGLAVPVVVSTCVEVWGVKDGWMVVFNATATMCLVSLATWKIYQTSEVVHDLNAPYKEGGSRCGCLCAPSASLAASIKNA
jgi:hypothetical protein